MTINIEKFKQWYHLDKVNSSQTSQTSQTPKTITYNKVPQNTKKIISYEDAKKILGNLKN